MPDPKIDLLYSAVSKDYDVGTIDEFKAKLQDDTKRKAFYDGVGAEYELGDYATFSGKVKKNPIPPVQKNGSPSSLSGLGVSQDFQTNTVEPLVPTPLVGEQRKQAIQQAKTYVKPKTKPKTIKEAVDDDNNYLGAIWNQVADSASDAVGGLVKLGLRSQPSFNMLSSPEMAEQIGNYSADIVNQVRTESSSKENEEKIQSGFDVTNGLSKEDAKALPLMITRLATDIGLAIPTGGGTFIAQGWSQGTREYDKVAGEKADTNVRDLYGMGYAIVNGLLDKVGMDLLLKTPVVSKAVKNFILKSGVQALSKTEGKITAGVIENTFAKIAKESVNKIKTAGVKTLISGGGEGGTEAIQGGLTDALKILSNKLQGEEVFKEEEVAENFWKARINDLAGGVVLGGALGGGMAALRSTDSYVSERIAEATSPEQLAQVQAELGQEVDSGNLDPERAEILSRNIERYSNAVAKLPNDMSVAKRKAVIGKIVERDNLREYKQTVTEQSVNVDEALQPEIDQEVVNIDHKEQFLNDGIREDATGEKYKYFQDEDGKKHFKQLGEGKAEEITPEYYEFQKSDRGIKIEPDVEVELDTEEKITKEAQEAEKKFSEGGDQVEYEQTLVSLEQRAQALAPIENKLVEPEISSDLPNEEGVTVQENTTLEPAINEQESTSTETEPIQEQPSGQAETPTIPETINETTGNIEVEPVVEPATETKEVETKRKRATVQKILKANYSAEFKSAITDDQIYYDALPKAVTENESNAIVEYLGRERASKEILDLNNGMNLPNRFAIAQKVMDAYEAEGDYDSSIAILEDLSKRITDTAQGLQSLSNFPKLGKATQVRYAQKEIGKQRDSFKKKHKPKTDKINKDFKKANEEAAKETVENVLPKLEEADKVKPKEVNRPAGYGAKNKLVTRDKYLKAKKDLRGKFFSGVPTELATIAAYHIEANSRDFAKFSRNMIVDLGNKVKPYLKDLYNKAKADLITNAEYLETDFLTEEEVDKEVRVLDGQEWKEKLESALAKGKKKEADIALAKLQEISKEEGLWGRYKKQAISKLKGTNVANTKADTDTNPPLREFTDGLVRNMQAKLNEALPEKSKAERPPARPAIEILGDAYKNFEKYQEVWEETQKAFTEKYKDEPDVLDIMDEHFGEILEIPFSRKYVSKSVSEGLNEMGVTGASIGNATPKPKREGTISLSKLVMEHYTVVDNTKRRLVDKLIDEAGLEGKEAQELAEAIETEFDRVATIKKQKALEAIFSKKERKKPAIKTLEGELIKLSNLGAFRDGDLVEAYGDKMGFPKLTEENVKEIERLSDIVQRIPESPRKRRAIEDLLAYQAGIKGVSITEIATAVWYANMLSGMWTQAVNIVANASNVALLYANAIAQNQKSGRFVAKGLVEGIRRGLLEGKESILTGYSPIKGKAEVPSLLERYKFEGFAKPLNSLKYVRRAMVAADVVFFEGLKEMRAYQLAYKMALEEGKLEPTLDQRNRAIEIVGKSDGQLEIIKEQAQLELEKEISEINSLDITDKQKNNLISEAESDNQRRIFDLIEQQRGDLIEETAHYAAKGTYNYPPKGALGAAASMINQLVENVPLFRWVVPFTNIIANVANESIEYTPLGFTRLKKGGFTDFRREPLTPQERLDAKTKAIIGTTLMASVAILASVGMGDDDEPILEITANGTGDYRKNEVLKESGWQPYSYRVKNSDGTYGSWVSYQYSPLLPSLAFIGNYKDLTKYKEDTDEAIHTKLGKTAGMTVSAFFQATYLQGLEQFLSSIIDQRSSDKFGDKVTRSVTGAVKGLILPNAYTQAAKLIEDINNVPLKEVRGTIGGSILQDIPYARDAYYNKVNILGDPLTPDTDKFFSNNKADKYIQLIVDKNAIWAPMSPKTEKIYDIKTQKERAYTEKEFYELSVAKGQFIKKALTDNYEQLSKLDDKQFKKVLTKIKTRATKVARYKVMKLSPPEEK